MRHMNDDDIDAITASLPTMFAPTLVSRTGNSGVATNISDWTGDPEYGDEGLATEDIFNLVDMTLCDGDSSPPQSPNQALSEHKEDGYSILADPYFDHTLVDDEAFHDTSRSRKSRSVAPKSLSHSGPSTSTQKPSSRGNEITLEERLKATAQGFHGSISQAEREAMIARIMALTSRQHLLPSTGDKSQRPAQPDGADLAHSPYEHSGLSDTSLQRGTQSSTASKPKRQHSSNDSFDIRREKQSRTDSSLKPTLNRHFDGPPRGCHSRY